MKNQFSDKETSQMVKELGFDEECTHIISQREVLALCRFKDGIYVSLKNSDDVAKKYCTAPLWQQIEEWLWEKESRTWINIVRNLGEYSFSVFQEGIQISMPSAKFDSPLTAKREGIKAVVKYIHKQL